MEAHILAHMPLVLIDIVNSVLGPELRAEWDDECPNLQINSFEICKRAYGLWRQSGQVSKRVAVTANSRVETDRTRDLAQPLQPNSAQLWRCR